jgi:uncharacterized protein (TIGR03435 family)
MADRAQFEVASIKPSKDCGGSRGRRNGTPGRLTIDCQTLLGLVQTAYFVFADGHVNPDFPPPSIEGGPSWINSDRYTVEAKAAGTLPHDREVMQGPMLQALLEDRFQLKVHFEIRGKVPVYILSVARGGPRLEPFQVGSCVPIESSMFLPSQETPEDKRCPGSVLNGTEPNMNVLSLQGATLDQFAGMLTYPLFRTVIDRTGITGRYDFHLRIRDR